MKKNSIIIIVGSGYRGSHTNKLLNILRYNSIIIDNIVKNIIFLNIKGEKYGY